MALITPETAREMRAKSVITRAANQLKREAEIAEREIVFQALLDEHVKRVAQAPPEADDYVQRRLMRVRTQLDRLDAMMLIEENSQALDRIAAAAARLSEQERILAGRPLPGSHRPVKSPHKGSDSGQVTPE